MATTKLDRKALAARAAKLPREDVDVPPWNGSVTIQAMTGTERDAYEASITGSTAPAKGNNSVRKLNLVNVRARLIARCLIDPDTGELMYNPNHPGDLDELGALDAAGLDIVFKACQRLNGIGDEDINALTKNSSAEAKDGSGLG